MNAVLVLLVSLLVGAIPFSGLAAWRLRRVDLREYGTGTVSGSSLYRIAGFGPMAAAGIFDVAKGAVGPLLAGHHRPELAALAGGLAVVGHDWSPFLRGAGGRGLSVSLGVLLVLGWPGIVLVMGLFVLGLIVRQSGLATFVGMLLLAPMLGVLYGVHGVWTGLALAVPMFAKRISGNRPAPSPKPAAYVSRLLFDHDPGGKTETEREGDDASRSVHGGTLDGYRAGSASIDPTDCPGKPT